MILLGVVVLWKWKKMRTVVEKKLEVTREGGETLGEEARSVAEMKTRENGIEEKEKQGKVLWALLSVVVMVKLRT